MKRLIVMYDYHSSGDHPSVYKYIDELCKRNVFDEKFSEIRRVGIDYSNLPKDYSKHIRHIDASQHPTVILWLSPTAVNRDKKSAWVQAATKGPVTKMFHALVDKLKNVEFLYYPESTKKEWTVYPISSEKYPTTKMVGQVKKPISLEKWLKKGNHDEGTKLKSIEDEHSIPSVSKFFSAPSEDENFDLKKFFKKTKFFK